MPIYYSAIFLVSTILCHYLMLEWDSSNSLSSGLAFLNYSLFVISYYLIVKSVLKNKVSKFDTHVFIAFLSKLILVFSPILLTGDIPRYVFEGFLLRNGFSPYEIAPVEFIGSFSSQLLNQIEYKNMSAIYPPATLLFFSAFASSVFSWKIFLFSVEILNFLLIIKILRQKKLSKYYSFIYLFSPLALIEISLSAHFEGLMISFMLLFYYYFNKVRDDKNIILASLFMAIAIAIKYVPIILFIIFLSRLYKDKKNKLALKYVGITLIIFLVLTIPFLSNGYTESLFTYVSHWRFNDSLLHFFGEFFFVDWQDLNSFKSIKLILFLIWACIFVFLNLKGKNTDKKIIYSFGLLLVFSSVVHPWYALWFLPFLCFYPSTSFLYLSVSLLLSYQAKLLSIEDPSIFIKFLEYVPFFTLLMLTIYKTSLIKSET